MPNQDLLKKAAGVTPDDWNNIQAKAEALMVGHKFGCSEAIMLAFQEAFADIPPAAVAFSSSFRGGMGGAGCTCGALAAGQMVLGFFFGYHGDANGEQSPEAVKKARALYQEMHDRFKKTNKSSCCRVLTKGLRPDQPERKAQCVRLVKDAATIASEIIARESARQ